MNDLNIETLDSATAILKNLKFKDESLVQSGVIHLRKQVLYVLSGLILVGVSLILAKRTIKALR